MKRLTPVNSRCSARFNEHFADEPVERATLERPVSDNQTTALIRTRTNLNFVFGTAGKVKTQRSIFHPNLDRQAPATLNDQTNRL